VAGPDTDYLWILSRKPQLEEEIFNQLVAQAKSSGFDTDSLILVDQLQQ
jgi:apolipoprotein D and lipocalin family protein